MAEPEIIDEFYYNEPPPTIPGGNQRPSKRVDLGEYQAIQRRQELNAILLLRTCGREKALDRPLKSEDLPLLSQISRERNPNGNPAIRKHAINALAEFRDIGASELLWEIASSDMEAETIRGHALVAFARSTPRMAPVVLQRFLYDKSALIRQATVKGLAEVGSEFTLALLLQMLAKEKDIGVRQRAAVAVESLGKRLGVKVPKAKLRERPKKSLRPTSEK
jgi:HEAT repeats